MKEEIRVIKPDQIECFQELRGFISVCQYEAGMEILDGEVGSICSWTKKAPVLIDGVFCMEVTRRVRIIAKGEL